MIKQQENERLLYLAEPTPQLPPAYPGHTRVAMGLYPRISEDESDRLVVDYWFETLGRWSGYYTIGYYTIGYYTIDQRETLVPRMIQCVYTRYTYYL